jgi:PAS domain S-box-containing protein
MSTATRGLFSEWFASQTSKHQISVLQYLLRVVLVFALYLAAGKLGLLVPFTSGNVSPVWPASGVAMAAVVIWGFEIWPGIALAAFLVNLSSIPTQSAVGIAVGNTASALFGGYLFSRLAKFQLSLSRLRGVLGLVIAALASPIAAASVGVATLFFTHVQAWSGMGPAWRVWWLGDAMGVLIVTPLFFAAREFVGSFQRAQLVEVLALFLGLITACFTIFGHTGLSVRDDVLAFVVFPFVIWAALRFRVAGVAMVCFLIAAFAIWGTAEGNGPFAKHSPLHNAVLLQLFIAVTSITGLILAAVIVERIRTEEKLSDQAQLLDLVNDAIFVSTLDDTITYWNQGAERLYGWRREEVLGRTIHDTLRTEFPQPFPEIRAQVLRDGSWRGELTHSKRDGSRITVSSRWSMWRDKEERPLGFLELNTDITDRKQAEDNVRALSGRLLQLQDDERRHIARELHDSAGQILIALGMNLASIEHEGKQLSAKAREACRAGLELVQELSGELRTISHLLHPPLLDEAGLASAVQLYVEGFAERSKIAVELELLPEFGRLSPEAETAIFRIVQECLTNIHRHSGSTRASIRIARDIREVRVEVRDQGKGIPAGKHPNSPAFKTGVGIQGMKERMAQLGGQFEIRSGKNGTIVVATLPVTKTSVASADGLAS